MLRKILTVVSFAGRGKGHYSGVAACVFWPDLVDGEAGDDGLIYGV